MYYVIIFVAQPLRLAFYEKCVFSADDWIFISAAQYYCEGEILKDWDASFQCRTILSMATAGFCWHGAKRWSTQRCTMADYHYLRAGAAPMGTELNLK